MQLAKAYNSLTNSSWKKLWWITLFTKFVISFFIPFFSDEAYYWMWAKNLQLSYFDHPPMVAWLFSLGQIFDSFGTASRLPFVFLSHATIWIWCHNLTPSFNESSKLILFLILALHPLTGLGGFVANPDIPFLFFWTLSVFVFTQAIEKPESKKLSCLLGAVLGLAFCSKYLIAFILPAFFIYLFLNRRKVRVPFKNIILTTVFGFIFSFPVLVWNYQNDWISFIFQVNHGLGQNNWKPTWTIEFILGTGFLLFPPFLYVYFKNKLWKLNHVHNLLFLTLISFFIYTTFKGDTELNWPVVMYPSFFYLVAHLVKINSKSIKSYVLIFGSLSVFLIGGTLGFWGENLHGRLVEAQRYKKIYESTQSLNPLFLSTYQSASYFWFLSKTPHYKLKGSSRVDFFDFMPESSPNLDLFYYIKEQYQPIPDSYLKDYAFIKVNDLDYKFEVYEVRRKN